MDGFGFTIFGMGYLEKGACRVRGTLKQGGQENSLEQDSSLGEQFEIRICGDKQLFLTSRTLQGQAPFTNHIDSNSGG
jgi:hypothetical protein